MILVVSTTCSTFSRRSSCSTKAKQLVFFFTAVFCCQVATAFQVVVSPSLFTTTTTTSQLMLSRPSTSSSSFTQTMESTNKDKKTMILLNGVQDLVDAYDVFLLDMWGVMHDGSRPYPGVVETIQKLRSNNDKKLIILSNSSKRLDDSIRMLQKLGFDPLLNFAQVITSGEVAYQMLYATGDKSIQQQSSSVKDKDQKLLVENNNYNIDLSSRGCPPWKVLVDIQNRVQQGKLAQHAVFVLGSGDGDEEYCTSAGWKLSSLDDAVLIIARGAFTINDGSGVVIEKDKNEQFYHDKLNECLAHAARRQIPMLVTNPDKVRPDADRNPMPGQIGDAYEKALCEFNSNVDTQQAEHLVKRIGKPDLDVYKIALHGLLEEEQEDYSRRAVMIGDALETDITGGSMAGIDTVWALLNGIHSSELVVDEEAVVKNSDDSSTAVAMEKTENDLLVEKARVVLDTFNSQRGTYAKDHKLTPTILLKHFRW